jgi:phosphoglycolate phosphatase-like HAD superfamily hydrolase
VVAVLCGGFGRAELEDEGAVMVLEDLTELRAELDHLLALERATSMR